MDEETRTEDTPVLPDNEATRGLAAELIGRGGVLAFRTDTFYGIGADPFNAAAVRRVNELKGREGKPILVIVSTILQARRLADNLTETFESLAELFWPGPLTLVAAADAGLPEELTAGTGTVGVRLPADELARGFVEACGGALTATSANRAGGRPAVSAQEVSSAFPGGLDLIVDGGVTTAVEPSTVVDVTVGKPRLVREGALPWASLLAALGRV